MISVSYDPSMEDICHITNNLREDDVREISAFNASLDPQAWGMENFHHPGWKTVFYLDDEPVAMYRFYSAYPGVWHAFLMATPKIEKIKLSLIRYGKKIIFPTLLNDMHARIIYTQSIAWRNQSQSWLEFWGAKLENTMRGLGRNGEDVNVYFWRREESA